MLPQVVHDTVGNDQHDVVFLQSDLGHHRIFAGRINAVGAQLHGTVEPMPLFGGAEEDFLFAGADDDNLAIAQVRYVEEG